MLDLRSLSRLTWPKLLDILAIGTYKTRRTGRVYLHCLWHEEKTPSLVLYPDGEPWHYHCYGCQTDGNAVDFVAKVVFKEDFADSYPDNGSTQKEIRARAEDFLIRADAGRLLPPAETFFGQPWAD